LATFPNIGDKSEYRSIVERMWRTYPSIGHEGTEKMGMNVILSLVQWC